MIQKVKTYANVGLEGHEIIIEADSSKSLPTIEIVGLPDAAIKESKERLRGTFRNAGIQLPNRKIVLNLSPSDIKKVGTSFDLPMAVAILFLIFEDKIKLPQQEFLYFGELGLDGNVKRVNGLLPSVISAMHHGYKHFFVPEENVYELEYVPGIVMYPIGKFDQMIEYFLEGKEFFCIDQPKNIETLYQQSEIFDVDFAHIKGQLIAKRALAIAAAGLHNVLMVGAPGSGKTLLSKAMQSILPPLGFEEILEVSQVYSLVGKLSKDIPLVTKRPFRQVHHTASKISIVGGGSQLTPGEVSLAHKGILFFDEVTEFPREVLEVLRQPLEDRYVVISRVAGTIQYPANFMFVGAMNPCKCGYYKDSEKSCSCSLMDIKRYQSKISGPLLDRIDMILEIPREDIDKILNNIGEESSLTIRDKVINARKIQQQRFLGLSITSNSQITSKHIDELIPLDDACKNFLSEASRKLTLSTRVVHRTIKLARTIADIQGQDFVTINHLAEALQYRSKTMFVESE
ncbi:MAG: YifB family Mg chelatase-like AAA ATPase [candidate division SR1 bacterium]|nr:YifB family Mg chelatase-like AAA ATPase [candidate division SR1 bacterium]